MVEHLLILDGLPTDTTEDELKFYLTNNKEIPTDGLQIKYKPGASTAKAIYHKRRFFAEDLLRAGFVNIRNCHVTVKDGKPKPLAAPPHQPRTSHPTTKSQTGDPLSQNASPKTPDTPPPSRPQRASVPGHQSGPNRQLSDPHSQSGSQTSSPSPSSSPVTNVDCIPATVSTVARSAINITKPSVIAYYTTRYGNARLDRLHRNHNVKIDVLPGVTKCRFVAENFKLYIVRVELSDFKCDAFISTDSHLASQNERCFQMELPYCKDGRGWLFHEQLGLIIHTCLCNDKRSIAIPVLGADTHGYPLRESIQGIVETIHEFFTTNPDCKMHIYLVDHDQWVVDIMHEVLTFYFDGSIECFPHSQDGSSDYDRVRLDGDALVTLSGSATIQLVQGDLAMEHCGAIVNSIAKDLKGLLEGELSKRLVKQGGSTFQALRESLSVEPGKIEITESGNMPCTYVFHGNCKKWDGENGRSPKLLCDVINACLKAADLRKCDSISFPALGTGKLNTPPEIAAKVMLTEIITYLNKAPNTNIKNVRIVIFDKKEDIFKVFQQEFQLRNRRNEIKLNTPVKLCIKKMKTKKPKCVILMKGSVNDLTVIIKTGDITKNKHRVNVIVNGSNGQLSLGGNIGKALTADGGAEFVNDCKNLGKIPHILRFSKSGNLKCDAVLHIDLEALETNEDWNKAIMACLLETEMRGYKTITFPLLGTGQTEALSQYDLAEVFMQSFTEFAMAGHKHIETIRVVEYSKTGTGSFQGEIDNYLKGRQWMYSLKNFASKISKLKGYIWDKWDNLHWLEIQEISTEGAVANSTPVNADHSVQRNSKDYDKSRGMTLWVEGDKANVQSFIDAIKEDINVGNTTIRGARRQQITQGAVNRNTDTKRESDVDIATLNEVLKALDEDQQNKEPRIDQGQEHAAQPRRRRIMVPDNATDQDIERLKIQHGIQDNKPRKDNIPAAVPFGHTNYVPSQANKPAPRRRVMVSDDVTDEEEDVYEPRGRPLPAQPTSRHAINYRHRSFDDSYHEEEDQWEDNDEYCGGGAVSDRLIDYRTNSESESSNYSRDNSDPGHLTTYSRDNSDLGHWTPGVIVIRSSDSNSEECDRNSELSEQPGGRYRDVSQRRELSIRGTPDNTYTAISKRVVPKLPQDSNNSFDMSTGVGPKHTSSISIPEHQNTRDVRPKVPRGGNQRNTEVAPTTGIRPKPNQESSPPTKQGDNGLPITWSPMHDDDLVIDVPLDSSSPEYQNISSLFMKGTDNFFTITQIIRIQNPTFYLKVDLHRKFLEKKNKRGVTKMLWHGTKRELLETINTNGFNRSYCGLNATYFGKGVYFARDVEYACRDTYSQPDPDGYKYVYYCKVLIGEFTQGTENMIDAPAKDPDLPHIKYDSVVNDMDDPKTHVIFSDTQAYPEYLVKFR